MHSEVQDYLEKIASNILDITEAKMSSSSSITHAAHHLIVTQAVASVSDRRNAARATYPLFRVADLRKDILATQELLIEAVKVHRKRIKDNSGIKFSNLQPLLQPLGYRTHFFSAVFRDKMDELGVARGEVAHASGAFVQNLPTGARELQRFADIEQGLSMIDRYVPRLLIPLW
jgi:hypothetical protein